MIHNLKPSWNHVFQRGIYTNGDELSYDYIALARKTKRLTFNTIFLNNDYKLQHWSETPFNEIKIAPLYLKVPEVYHHILNDEPETVLEMDDFAQSLISVLESYFVEKWNSDPKIIFHSGGFDSRIISIVLMNLLKKYGKEWLGKIHFRCHQPECELFTEIMQREGWDPEYYSCYEGPDEDYYDIGNPAKPMNGWHNYNQRMNFWHDIIPEQEEKNWILISGMGGEIYKFIALYDKSDADYCNNLKLNLVCEHNPNKGEWENMWTMQFKDMWMPFFSYDYLQLSLRAPKEFCQFDGSTDTMRRKIVEVSGYNLSDLPHGKHDYSWNISNQRKGEMLEAFYGSRFFKLYGKHIGIIDPITKMYGWDAKIWSFMTVYEEIFK